MVENEERLGLHSDALETIEILIHKAQLPKKGELLDMYIPILVNMLVDETRDKSANNSTRLQHEMALVKLTRIGSQFPQDFKRILSTNGELKERVETAVIQNQTRERNKLLASQQKSLPVNQPSIKLKTDFSNFK